MSRSMRAGLFFLLLSFVVALPVFAGDDWLQVPKEDLAMKDYANIPGQHAVILYRKVERSDKEAFEKNYVRIKILDEEGKKYANVETEAFSKEYHLDGLQARTVKADGTVIPFNGKVFDKLVAKYKDYAVYAKSFSIPDVQPGDVIEYKYVFHWEVGWLFRSEWLVQQELATRDADFSLKAYQNSGDALDERFTLSWSIFFLPKEEQPKEEKGIVKLTAHNVPPLEKEEYIPPQKELQARVEFIYTEGTYPKNADEYWNKQATKWSKDAESFMDKQNAAKNEVAGLVSPNDPPEAKLRKLYDRVQKLRNLTFERSKTEKEAKVEKLKDNNNIEDVLKHGYAYHNTLNRTFTALARAAGFPATLIRINERDQSFPHKEIWNFRNFDTEISVVTVDGKQMYLDPGVPLCPFGLISWEDTGVTGLVLDRNKATWGNTPQPGPDEYIERRTADMALDSEGTLSGSITVTYEGRAALWRRLTSREDDDAERKKDLEKMFKNLISDGSTVELTKIDDWNAATDKFAVTAKVSVPGFAAATGKRVMVPISVFPGADKHPFTHARRVNPVYFHSPYREIDDIKIKLPDGLQAESLPQARILPTEWSELKLTVGKDNQTIKIGREVTISGYYFPSQYYPNVREFFDKVKAVGDEQAVLRAAAK